MCVPLLLLCIAATPPASEAIPRWIPELPHPAELHGVWMISATNAMLTNPDVKFRRSAAAAVSQSRDPQVVLPLLRAFEDKDAEVRRQAAWHFNGFTAPPDPRAFEPLLKLLHDPDASVSALATIAETEERWSKLTRTQIAAEQAGVNGLCGKAQIYFRGDPFVIHDARPSLAPTVLIGADNLVEGVVASSGSATIHDIDMKYLEKMPGIRALRLERSKITPAGLVHAKRLPGLEFLGLPASIGDADIQFLAGLRRLSILRLQGKGITDDGLKLVARLRGLTRLSLQGTAISDSGLKRLIGLKQLKELSLGWTQIGDIGLEQLAVMKQLQELRVNDTRVTSQGVERLQKALPNCQIVREWPMYVGRHAI